MLAETGSLFDSEEYQYEVKWDGLRALAYLEGSTRLYSRRLLPMEGRFPELTQLHRCVAGAAILDGEVVVWNEDGRPDFDLARDRNLLSGSAAERASRRWPATLMVFDILFWEGALRLDEPLHRRRERLLAVVKETPHLRISTATQGKGHALYEAALAQQLEGIVAKHLDSPYLPGQRSRWWLKVRRTWTADCVIAGFTLRAPGELSALVLGAWEGSTLRYVGRVGTGFSEAEKVPLLAALQRLVVSGPVIQGVPADVAARAWWTKPVLVCQVTYHGLTRGGLLRQPSYQHLRSDKSPEACQWPPG